MRLGEHAAARLLACLILFGIGCDDSRAEPTTAPAAVTPSAPKKPRQGTEPTAEGKTLTQLLAMLSSADQVERINGAVALNKIELTDDDDKMRVVLALGGALKDKESTVVSFAAAGLVRLGLEGRLELIGQINNDSKNEIDDIAVTQLAKAGKDGVDPLVAMLEHEQREKAAMAAIALTSIGKPAIPALIAATRPAAGHRPNQKRALAVVALGGMGPAAREAIPALEERLNDREAGIREIAAEALRAIKADR
jgi:HEAT repeat protein